MYNEIIERKKKKRGILFSFVYLHLFSTLFLDLMEKDQEVKHICKFCYKSFPCGRALGGHMRSHLHNNTAESAGKFSSKKKLSTLIIYDNNEDPGFKDDDATQIAYSLRENRKKTSKFVKSSEDSFSLDNKALFSHIDHLSDKTSKSIEDDSLNYCNEDSQSDNDNEFAAPTRRQRSSRTFKRYRNSDTTLSAINTLECVSETEQEQEEVALSLILLSMDIYNQRVDLKSIDDSSDNNNSEFQEAMSVTRSDSKNFSCSENMILNSKTLSSIEMEFERSSKLGDAFLKGSLIRKGEVEERKESHDHEPKKNKPRKRKLKALDQSQVITADCSMKLVCDNVSDSQDMEYLNSEKKIKFECTSCDKTFDSYQALGGHRASHKKKASLGTENSTDTDISTVTPQNMNVSTNSVVTSQNLEPSITAVKFAVTSNTATTSPVTSQNIEPSNVTAAMLPITSQNLRSDSAMMMSIPRPRVFDPKFKSRKVIISDGEIKKLTNSDHGLSKKHNKLHECPLCFKVFPSGQAFGGHKRYHLLAEAKINNNNNNNNQQTEKTESSVTNQEQIPEKIRDFLDLNLPAPEQEEISGASNNNPWWMASNHKRQPLHVGPL